MSPPAGAAQRERNRRAGIRGVVVTAAGSPIAQAVVSLEQNGVAVGQKFRTGSDGAFRFPRIAVTRTRVHAERMGFVSTDIDIDLEAGTPADVKLVLAPKENAAQETAEVSQDLDERDIENVPMGDRRSMNLVGSVGTAVFLGYESGQKPKFSLAGGRSQSQMFTIDGGNGQGIRLAGGQIDSDPPAESLTGLKVVSNGYLAEHGGSAGGVVMSRIKSGSNRMRGSLFEYLRNDRLDAANFFAPVAGDEKIKAPLRYNVFGGTFGGPVRRDRLFFFGSYEGSRRREGTTRSLTVPTALQRAGDFSSTLNTQGRLVAIYDPATTRLSGSRNVRDIFPGNIVPVSRIDPVAAKVSSYYPAPNVLDATSTGAANFRANSSRGFTRDHLTAKLDYTPGGKDRFSGRYMFEAHDQVTTSVYPEPAAENQPDTYNSQHNVFASWLRTVNPVLLNDLRVSWSNRTTHQVSKGLGGDWPSQLGLRGVPETAFPRFQANGYAPLGANNQEKRQFPVAQFQLLDSVSWSRGRHALKFGVEFRPSHNVEIDLPTVSGSFAFSPQPTALPGQTGGGNSFAALLLGFPTSFTQRRTETLDRSSRYLAGFAQDAWAISPRLVLTLGVRWETDTPIVDRNARFNGFDMSAINPVSGTPGVVRFAGIDGWPASPYRTDWNNFAPRVGFAWRPGTQSRLVLRGGYGVFMAQPFDHSASSAASLGYELSARLVSPDSGITAPFYLRDGVPVTARAPVLDSAFGAVPAGQVPTTAVSFFESGRRTGYAHQFHLSVQREIPRLFTLEAGILGNLGRKLASPDLSINQIRPDLMGPTASQKDRPFPQFSDVQIVLPSLGVSSYRAAMLKAERRLSRGLDFTASYTFARHLTNAEEGGPGEGDKGSYSDFYNRAADWGPADSDIRHRFSMNAVYDLPFGREHSLLSRGWIGAIVGDWTLGSMVTVQSGAPLTVTTLSNTANAFSAGPLRADAVANPELAAASRTLARWFDISAYAQPAPYTFGNPGAWEPRADGIVGLDVSLTRTFSIGERWRAQFRCEAFNFINHANFGAPGQVLGAPDFGVVDSAGPARRLQLGLRLTF